jgi:hypothetical protein
MLLVGHVANPGLASFDISWMDTDINVYFLADRSNKSVDLIATNINPLNLPIAQLVRLVPQGANAFAGTGGACGTDCAGPNGVITITTTINGKELWVGDGNSTVKIFTAQGGNVPFRTINTGGAFRADELCWDANAAIPTVVVANDSPNETGGPFVSFIPTEGPTAYTITGQLHFAEATNGIEQCQAANNGSGRVLINIPEVNGPGTDVQPGAVYTLNTQLRSRTGKHQVNIGDCAGPQGMVVVPGRNSTLLGCNAFSPAVGNANPVQNSVVVFTNSVSDDDNDNANTRCRLGGLGGSDQVSFNPADGHLFLALGSHAVPGSQTAPGVPQGANNGSQQLLGVADSSNCDEDSSVFVGSAGGTGRRSHSVASDPGTGFTGLPVSATGGAATGPGFQSDLCNVDAALGCVTAFVAEFLDGDDQGDL